VFDLVGQIHHQARIAGLESEVALLRSEKVSPCDW
jgi:hypothetical protein